MVDLITYLIDIAATSWAVIAWVAIIYTIFGGKGKNKNGRGFE